MMPKHPKRVLIKLGGAALVDDSVLDVVGAAVLSLRAQGMQVVLVHGGGPAINAELTRRGITWEFLHGQRVTTPEMMGVIESTLCGSVNRQLVRRLGAMGLPTLGFSGADRQTLKCVPVSKEHGLVGAVQIVNSDWIDDMINSPMAPVPVIAPIGVGEAGEAFNINADWAASYLATALDVDQLIFLTDQPGILDTQGKLIPSLKSDELQTLVDREVVKGGMLTKTLSILYALNEGVRSVRVMNGKDAFKGRTSSEVGTWCTKTTHKEVMTYVAV